MGALPRLPLQGEQRIISKRLSIFASGYAETVEGFSDHFTLGASPQASRVGQSMLQCEAFCRAFMILPVLIAIGALLRIGYAITTRPGLRAHDYRGHLEYIQYVLTNGTIPPSQDGWEFHQPPLYYYAVSMWTEVTRAFSSVLSLDRAAQSFGTLLSICTLLVFVLLGKELFPEKKERWKSWLFVALLASLPSLIFTAGAVNNDSLHQLIGAAFLLMLVRWWKRAEDGDWTKVSFLLGAGLLTKASTLVLLPPALLTLLARKVPDWRHKAKLAGVTAAVTGLLFGGLIAYRAQEAETERLLKFGNIGISPSLLIENRPAAFLVFRPLAVVNQPFAISGQAGRGREFFWEYFYRTIFFSSWSFPGIVGVCSTVLAVGLLGAVFFLLGALRDVRRRAAANLPMLTTGAFLMASLLAYRFIYQYPANQNFRLIAPLAPVLAYYALRGLDSLPSGLRPWGAAVLWLLAGLCSLSVLLMVFGVAS